MVSPIIRSVAVVALFAVFVAAQCSETCAVGQETAHQTSESSQSGCHHGSPVQKHESKTCIHQLTAARADTAPTKLTLCPNATLTAIAVLPTATTLPVYEVAARRCFNASPPSSMTAVLSSTVLRI